METKVVTADEICLSAVAVSSSAHLSLAEDFSDPRERLSDQDRLRFLNYISSLDGEKIVEALPSLVRYLCWGENRAIIDGLLGLLEKAQTPIEAALPGLVRIAGQRRNCARAIELLSKTPLGRAALLLPAELLKETLDEKDSLVPVLEKAIDTAQDEWEQNGALHSSKARQQPREPAICSELLAQVRCQDNNQLPQFGPSAADNAKALPDSAKRVVACWLSALLTPIDQANQKSTESLQRSCLSGLAAIGNYVPEGWGGLWSAKALQSSENLELRGRTRLALYEMNPELGESLIAMARNDLHRKSYDNGRTYDANLCTAMISSGSAEQTSIALKLIDKLLEKAATLTELDSALAGFENLESDLDAGISILKKHDLLNKHPYKTADVYAFLIYNFRQLAVAPSQHPTFAEMLRSLYFQNFTANSTAREPVRTAFSNLVDLCKIDIDKALIANGDLSDPKINGSRELLSRIHFIASQILEEGGLASQAKSSYIKMAKDCEEYLRKFKKRIGGKR